MNLFVPLLSIKYHGGTRVICEMLDYFKKHNDNDNVNVLVLCPKNSIQTDFLTDSVDVKEIGIKKYRFIPKIMHQLLFMVCFIYFIRKEKGAVLANFFITWYPCFIAHKFFDFKLYYFIQGLEGLYKGAVGRNLNKLCTLTYKYKKQAIIPANLFLKNEIRNYNSSSIVSFDYTVGLNNKFLNEFKYEERAVDICYFGRSENWKRIDRFFDLLRIFDDKHIHITVSFISQDKLAINLARDFLSEIDSSFIEVVFHSPSCQDELITKIRECKVFFGTSECEGFYLPPLESMSQFTLPILFDCGGPRLYINHKSNGYFVDEIEDAFNLIYMIKRNGLKDLNFLDMKKTAQYYSSDKSNRQFLDYIVLDLIND
ncbi:glycosyltransferase [Photobacterium satsumensis]|uniref:glycosyltransferase n=1 Tax=Photobacterium satsumensis TaxID=2910239 RepID=UPI003D11DB70